MHRKSSVCAGIVLFAAFSASGSDLDVSNSEMRPLIERFSADRGNLMRSYNISDSPARRERFRRFYEEMRATLDAQNFDAMKQTGKVDYVLFRNELDHELRRLDREAKEEADNAVYLPFAGT